MERTPLPDTEKKPSHLLHTARRSGQPELDNWLVKALAGEPVSLVVKGTAHLRSLQDLTAPCCCSPHRGMATYEVQLQFDPSRLDATLHCCASPNCRLANLIKSLVSVSCLS